MMDANTFITDSHCSNTKFQHNPESLVGREQDTSCHRSSTDGQDEKMCRICHGGEEEGKLISPCKCKGSIKYVHIECLNTWRQSSHNRKSYFQCENCHYKYNLKRTNYAKMVSSTLVLQILTLMALFLLIVMCGYIIKLWGYFLYNGQYVLVVHHPEQVTPHPSTLHEDQEEEEEEEPFEDEAEYTLEWQDMTVWSLFKIDGTQLVFGTLVVGMVGFFQTLILTRAGPFGFRHWGGGRGGRDTLEVIIIGIIIAVGLAKTAMTIYSVIRTQTQKFLAKAEEMVLEVQ